MEDYVRAAIENGIIEMCFTDHIPLPNGMDPEHRMKMEEVEPYLERIAILNRKFREITILAGIEVDYIEGFEPFYKEFFSTFNFDIAIMAVHFIKEWKGEQWVFNYEYSPETIPGQYKDYFNAVYKGVKTGLFDVLGHFDLIKRPGFPVMRYSRKDIDRILDEVKKKGMSIELNTSGLRKPIGDTYPSMNILYEAVDRGIPITMASDAHRPEHVGYLFDQWLNRLFGIEGLKLAQYRYRKCVSSPLGQPDFE